MTNLPGGVQNFLGARDLKDSSRLLPDSSSDTIYEIYPSSKLSPARLAGLLCRRDFCNIVSRLFTPRLRPFHRPSNGLAMVWSASVLSTASSDTEPTENKRHHGEHQPASFRLFPRKLHALPPIPSYRDRR